jgi:hypothetical protein
VIESYETEKNILKAVSRLIDSDKLQTKLRGEAFNVFSILGLEAKEDRTHSAFIAELLDPSGSHLMGPVFLDLFLEILELTDVIKTQSVTVECERGVGAVDYEGRTGGRIDIFLTDKKNTISIENKIFARDQPCQIERYINYNKSNNTVLYLTLGGTEPHKESRGEYKSGQDYECISYENHIIAWLERCLEKSYKEPILRESLRQYIILIKKLTGQFSGAQMNNELFKIIKENYKSARAIASSVDIAEQRVAAELFEAVKNELEIKVIGLDWNVKVDSDLTKANAALILYKEGYEDIFTINLIGNTRVWNTDLNYGVFCPKSEKKDNIFRVSRAAEEFKNFDKEDTNYPVWDWVEGASFTKVTTRERLFAEKDLKAMAQEIAMLLDACRKSITVVLNNSDIFEDEI